MLDMTPLFPEGDCFGIEHDLGFWAHAQPRTLDIDSTYPRIFSDDSLHLASCYVRHYLEGRDNFEWFHVMVRAVAWDSFLDAMHGDPESRCLVFSCWCNGGNIEEARYRQHRHLVVVSPKGRFLKEFWPKVKPDIRPYPNYRCKKEKKIVSARHLVNTLGYLSRRRSRCQFSFETRRSKAPRRNNHFHLYRSLPREFLLPLCLLWEGGLDEFLYQTQFQKASVMKIVERCLVYQHGRWQQKMKDFYRFEGGLVLPVLPDLSPTIDEENKLDVVLHLMAGRKLYFASSPEQTELDPERWLRKQAEGGNCFFDVVKDEWWSPRPWHQRILNIVKPLVDRNGELESEVATLKRKYVVQNGKLTRCKNAKRRLEMDVESQRLRIEQIRQYYEGELEKQKDINQQLRNENIQMKHEMEELRNKNAQWENKYVELANKYAQLENENARLKDVNENVQLKYENAQLRYEKLQLENKYAQLEAKYAQLEAKYAQLEAKYAQLEDKYALLENAPSKN